MEPTYVSAFKGIGNNAMYVGSDGNIYEHSGGTIAWRNNNPGNMRAYKSVFNRGAIGTGGGATEKAPGFAIFPDANTGWNAMVDLLSEPMYQNLTIEEAINKYSPPEENNVENYLKSLENQTGFPRITPMNNLSKDNLLKLAKAMKAHEGNKPGKKRLVPKNEKYMWVTEGDDKVRPEHEALDGEVRSWYDSPHPGEDFGCRCHAEAVD
ncbi:MAG: hypothetical protein LBK26_03400 [Rickettsiales bacterium]|jgi:SPP1 gp7 family putative phage head morphogenesis protein|nr:hypothetical protein [Rickettsiales bacterium]